MSEFSELEHIQSDSSTLGESNMRADTSMEETEAVPTRQYAPIMRSRQAIEVANVIPTDMHQRMNVEEVRWFYQQKEDNEKYALNGPDSVLLEMKFRVNKNIWLDENVDEIHRKHTEHGLSFRPSSITRSVSRRNSAVDPAYDGEHTVVQVFNRLYRVNWENDIAYPLYWKQDDIIQLKRGTHFVNDELIEPNIVERIEKLRPQITEEHYGETQDIAGIKVRFYNNAIAIQLKGDYQLTSRYSEKAIWDPSHLEVDHLVFAVHGVGHNGHEMSIVNSVKHLNRGINENAAKKCGIMIIPVHWRTGLRNEDLEKHTCDDLGGMLRYVEPIISPLDDVKIYNCSKCGILIKNTVIDKLNKLYKEFQKYNPSFSGTVSLFGHSLGSVICYDILTDVELSTKLAWGNTKQLFTVGSPLRYFIHGRKEKGINLFRDTVRRLQIHNIYHALDPVGYGLEEVVHPAYEKKPKIKIIMEKSNEKSIVNRMAAIATGAAVYLRDIFTSMSYPSEEERLPHPIDTLMEGDASKNEYHSIYWTEKGMHRHIAQIFGRLRQRPPARVANDLNTDPQTENGSILNNQLPETPDPRSSMRVEQPPTSTHGLNDSSSGDGLTIESTQLEESTGEPFISNMATTVSELDNMTVQSIHLERNNPTNAPLPTNQEDGPGDNQSENEDQFRNDATAVNPNRFTRQDVYNFVSGSLLAVTIPVTLSFIYKLIF